MSGVKMTYDPGDSGDPDVVTITGLGTGPEGIRFEAGKPVDVSEMFAVRMIGNPHFKSDNGKTERDLAEAKAKAEAEAAVKAKTVDPGKK